MKSLRKVLIVFCLSIFCCPASFGHYVERDLIGRRTSEKTLSEMYERLEEWRGKRRADFLRLLEVVPDSLRSKIVSQAENLVKADFATLPASDYLLYKQTGNRSNYQNVMFGRRRQITTLVMAELLEGKGRFVSKIMDGVWAVCEETTWCLHAHQNRRARSYGLPLPGEDRVDLFAAETAAQLTWILFLLEERFDALSPSVAMRIRYELQRRILSLNLCEDFHRMGLDGSPSNNWNVWINRNWLTVLTMSRAVDKSVFVASMKRFVKSIDNYTNWYPADGGCDEGVVYWGHSPGNYYDIVALLSEIMPDVYGGLRDEPLLYNMAAYHHKMEIGKGFYVNFGDGSPKAMPRIAEIYMWGAFLNSDEIKGYGAHCARQFGLKNLFLTTAIHEYYNLLKAAEGLKTTPPKTVMPLCSALPDIEVLTAREKAGSSEGFFLAVKGGNNGESHNHNDIGSVIVSLDGNPVLIDAGVEQYTKATFSSDRYSIWTMRSGWHNTPKVNGFEQKAGKSYAAVDFTTENRKNSSSARMDIAKAYPIDAGIKSWKREVVLNRGTGIEVRDEYSLAERTEPVEYNLITPLDADTSIPGEIWLSGKTRARILYDKSAFKVEVDRMELTDRGMKNVWGNTVYRLRLVSTNQSLRGKDVIRISR